MLCPSLILYIHPTFLAAPLWANLLQGKAEVGWFPGLAVAQLGEMLMPTFPGKCWWERKQTEDWYGYSLGEQMAVVFFLYLSKGCHLNFSKSKFWWGWGTMNRRPKAAQFITHSWKSHSKHARNSWLNIEEREVNCDLWKWSIFYFHRTGHGRLTSWAMISGLSVQCLPHGWTDPNFH